MREIKFRIWDKHFRKFDYFDIYSAWGRIPEDSRENIQQFTGISDCKDQEIWEGDILKNMTVGEEYCDPAVVVWGKYDEVGFAVAYKYSHDEIEPELSHEFNGLTLHEEFRLSTFGCYEVIGNIFENPELLTK